MLHDPMRSQARALAAGAVVAVLILAGAGVYGLIRPAPSVGDAMIVADPGGGLFVLVEGVMHPVPNVASARLVVGRPAPVKSVSARSLGEYPRGPVLGIAGAPASLPGPAQDGSSVWTVCDSRDGTVVVAGPRSAEPVDHGLGALVSHDASVWLLFDDRGVPVRARVETSRAEVTRALGVEQVDPRPVSAAFLDTFPVRPPLDVPDIAGRGDPGPLGARIGSVIRSSTVDGSFAYRVVLRDGVQQIPATAADMLRAADLDGDATVRDVAPGELTSVPSVDSLPLGHFPARAPRVVDRPQLCRTWSRARGERIAAESMTAVDVPPVDGVPVRLASADGSGPRLDAVYLRPGTAEHVAVTGSRADSALAGQRFLVADTGVRYRLAGDGAGPSLGLGDEPPLVPWSVLSLLPVGPELSRAAALVVRD